MPIDSTDSQVARCPSCGREVGSSVTCPYCGANLKRRATIAVFGVLALVLAVGGLALLYVASVNTPIQSVRVSEIEAAANYAYVRIDGRVRRSPNFNADTQSLTFVVDDGSGEILVAAFDPQARALIEAGQVPAVGDRVSVAGTVRVREGTPSLTLLSPEALSLSRATDAAAPRDLAAITPADALTGVAVRGQVRAVREPSAGFRLITIRDKSGEMDLVVDSDLEAFGPAAPVVQVGDAVAATGVVTLFEDRPQVTLTRGDGLSVLNQAIEIADLTPIADLDDEDVGGWVRVQGTIVEAAPFSAGVKFQLSDPQGRTVTLLLWQDVFAALPDAADWQIGAEATAQGLVNVFRGELEIVPELALDATLLTRAATAAGPPPPPASDFGLTPLGRIRPSLIGQTVFVSGTIESEERFDGGVRFQLRDDTGSIRLVLFDAVYQQVEDRDRLKTGASVSALGRVNEFQGALEVLPPNGASVRVAPPVQVARITPTPGPPRATATPLSTGVAAPTAAASVASPTPQPAGTLTPAPTAAATLALTPVEAETVSIGSIDASRIGQSVTVRGTVINTSSFSAGFRFTLRDESGTVVLVLFDGRYREVPDRAGLNLGGEVVVTAEVVEFNGALELQPANGQDVIIVRPGSTAGIPISPINSLWPPEIGKRVAIEGDVLRVEGFSAGVSVFVNDGTGEMRVVMFNNVLEFVPEAPALQAGARVRVVGRMDEFNGAAELVPSLGYDVVINP